MDTVKTILVVFSAALLLSACGASKRSNTVDTKAKTEPVKQVFVEEVGDAGPGECYNKVNTATGKKFMRTLCPDQLTTDLKQEIKSKLSDLGYSISKEEMQSPELGADTLAALIQFQNKAGLHSGILDPATMDALGITNY